jgi:hypothetical protein
MSIPHVYDQNRNFLTPLPFEQRLNCPELQHSDIALDFVLFVYDRDMT